MEEKFVTLSTIAKIIRPRVCRRKEKTALLVSPHSDYPLTEEQLRTSWPTDTVLQKGDIIFQYSGSFYLLYDDLGRELHTHGGFFVLRITDPRICPEYLYLYLKTGEGKRWLKERETGDLMRTVRRGDLETLPVALPEKSPNDYRYQFYSERFPASFLEKLPILKWKENKRFVFISYSTRDQQIADHTRSILETNGITCWMAPQSIAPGSDYAQEIPGAIERCGALLLILSGSSQASPWVPREVGLAIGKGKTVVPFQIDEAVITDAFNFYLGNSQRISAYNRMADAYEELTRRLADIL